MATMVRSDTSIQRDVLTELGWDPAVDATEVGVEVDDGVVTLTGWVDTYTKKLAAEDAAQRVEGVRAVANDISVKGVGAHTDTDIAKAVADAFETSTVVPSDLIEITVKNGKVTLQGEADWDFQRAAAARTVHDIQGVRDVVNLITIKPRPTSPSEIKSGIQEALMRNAQTDAEHIQVKVDRGHAALTGVVHSWAAKQAAAEAAWRSHGITSVTNDIVVRPA